MDLAGPRAVRRNWLTLRGIDVVTGQAPAVTGVLCLMMIGHQIGHAIKTLQDPGIGSARGREEKSYFGRMLCSAYHRQGARGTEPWAFLVNGFRPYAATIECSCTNFPGNLNSMANYQSIEVID